MKRCVFFDRDGIVNRSPGPGYVMRWEDFHLIPEFPVVLKQVLAKGFEAVIVTNQRGVDLGLMAESEVDNLHDKLRVRLRDEFGVDVLDVYYCPHGEGGCDCRKPKPGMLFAASVMHDIDLTQSWMIGDAERDVNAGREAGCKTILVGGDHGSTQADHAVRDMAELVRKLPDWI